ncbi:MULTISPECIES: hypothetical protein [unclassified Pseudomonas]|jgi:hypothetical protein|uniref:hypothetical protein n=1 Tax=unclassified Pseudomonas TaxID=196821 RepID=UPI000C88AD28|nr:MULTISPECIES: hypothetical protein [unclassified Pseudomonas]MBL1311232.1 hypothetical protein [Pseudomonas sp.]PMX19137.1 hypothetical protein C1Y25_00605 [Pseudomonas sp. MPBC4-3]PMX50098.1 hypothetical protein C1Y20_04320 [Pseudomonas sp. FW301-21B01]PMY10814.1 hypothetical protein C1Y18_02150 [Pseudomonas sp. MPR-R5A]PNA72981.1 hypothetical protein C1Y14_01705 [Pseudomonas sp. MPR-R5B]
MISILQNEVERLRPASDELAAQVEQFLAAGGKIDTSGQSKPRPEVLASLKQPPTFHRPAVKTETELQVARIREMAPTMSRRDICEKEGITLGVLKGIAGRYGITFPIRPKQPSPPNKVDSIRDAFLVVRIGECIAAGVSRQQCCIKLKISSTLLYRLIKEYEIDYPKLKPAFR